MISWFAFPCLPNRGIQGNCKSGIYFVIWALDFFTTWRNPKQEFFYLGPSHIPTGNCKMGNAHWEDTSSPLHCALVLSLIEITDTIYICATGLSEEMICLKSSVIFHVSNLYSTYSKYAMPFQQKNSFFDKGISWTIVLDIDRLYVTANFLMNVSTCFNWNQLNVASVMYQPVLENLLRQADPVFQVHRARLCLAIFLSSTQLLRNLLSLSSLLRRRYSVL